ncbi:MdtA/MuxA family multidrug efflux RND transporter periplasmic adaptor subunit [Roseateles saccharophilus]|uniref:Multidrug efflux system membrane fusion protein n=1 Tax=Roseateles saccharophilus TaxID=304 RepID=A0A4V2VQF7_ROSSA|nr:MdtA/MuxA family multidrug efflux RND transporter periplasmic adaptor subunit [Roseateles saccharophilus]MDG0833270.1 MdtA/MuxA family multidrug efflux RND transporter periplasmic adaptor subunit [Roseateles saccharophilus]TCU94379.1 multidrug efflux system membrane fusion protein [Roseateles saccharophilus]
MQKKNSSRSSTGAVRPWLLAGVAVAGVALGGWWWKGHGGAGAEGPASAASAAGGPGGGARGGRFPGANRPQPVSVAAVQRRDVAVAVEAIGSIASANTAVVRAKVGGELKAIYFKEGQAVKAGQALALIDPRPFEIARDQAQAALARDQAQLENARADLARYKDLVAKEAAPRQQLDTQQALVHQLEATILSDQATLDNARLQLSYTRVTAPISGQAGLKQADLGNNVAPTDANGLLSIAQTQPAAVVFAVPDARLARIRQQLGANLPLPVQAWDREHRQMLASGRVASTDNAIDANTGTIKVKALFPNQDNALFPNQFVNVRLQLDTLKDVLVVPTAAVQRGAPGTFVYVVADGQVALRKVQVLATDGESTGVQGELKAGDQVVTDGADRLRDGGKAEVIKAPAGGAGGAAGRGGDASGRPRWMDRVPPAMVDKLKSMSEEDRRAWIQQHRASAPQ